MKSSSIFMGIDPGLQGAVVVIDERNNVLGKFKTTVIKNTKGKNQYDVGGMVDILKKFQPNLVVLERAQPMPMQGTVSMFSIGKGFGIWMGILTALNYPHIIVHPKTWQKEVLRDLDRSDTKQASILYAERVFPKVDWRATEKCKNKDNNLTDAASMAVYAKNYFNH